jgi:hypothetical protein
MEIFSPKEIPQFASHEEEIAYLRKELAEKESALVESGQEVNREKLAHTTIAEYKATLDGIPRPPSMQMLQKEERELVLRLKPETHDNIMEELLATMISHGINSALKIVSELNNPHIDSDFHRFLVQYLCETQNIPGLKNTTELWKAIDMRLFEITLPEPEQGSDHSDFKSLITAMEQFYSGMHSVADTKNNKEKNYFSLEIVLANNTDHIVFYAAVPTEKASLLEKHVLGVHPKARINEVPDDYNIFPEDQGGVSASIGRLKNYEVFPIKKFDTFDYDPLNVLINVFTKLKRSGEGAAIQLTIYPQDEEYVDKFHSILEEVKKGEKVKEIMSDNFSKIATGFGSMAMDLFKNNKDKKEEEKKVDDEAVGYIQEKVKKTILGTNIRIVTAANTKERANSIRSEIESGFNQFTEAHKNGFEFDAIEDSKMGTFLHEYTYRLFNKNNVLPLNLSELATIFHFPFSVENSPQLKQAKAAGSPAPIEMGDMDPADGVLLGYNTYRGVTTPIYMRREDRMRHFYVIGQTGTGKSGVLRTMIAQDIANGDGCCYIDPHGTDIQDILSYVPKERMDDVIYFDPAYTARPMGLNMLEFDPKFPEQKTMVIDALMAMFNQLFDLKTSGGPLFEQYFKNSAMLVMDHPESGNTLLEITRVLADKEFRDMKMSHCKNPIVKQFWKSAEETTGDQSLANFVPYISSKFDPLISNEFLRPIIVQEKSIFNIRDIMDNKKILLVNLSKGRLGELNANLIGMILVMKFQMAALSRADSYGQKLNDFYLYIDEFQNVTTPAITSILSEARKYRLSLNLAHQYISQLQDDIKGAVFGNVGSKACFRISPEDADFMQKQLEPVFTSTDIMKLDNRCAYMAMLYKNQPVKPFDLRTADNPPSNIQIVPVLKELSYLRYGRDRDEVEREIIDKYNKSS